MSDAEDKELFKLLYGDGSGDNEDGKRGRANRPTYYKDLDLEKIKMLVTRGFTQAEIAFILGISGGLIKRMAAKNPEFRELLDEWREVANGRVERSLYENAIGYVHPETKVFYDSKTGQIVEHKIEKYYPPNVTAGKLWLMNKKPHKWKERIGHEMIGPDGNPMQVAHNINVTFIKPGGGEDDGDEES